MNKKALTLTTAIATGLVILGKIACGQALTVNLYNGSLETSLGAQGWNFLGGGTETLGGGSTTLDTSSNDMINSGYGRVVPSLNRTTGYTLGFNVQLLSEDHSNLAAQNNTDVDNIADRAGFSVIALGADNRGIELGFWTDEIWAQNDGAVKADPQNAPSGTRFTHGEGTSFNPASGLIRYDLSIVGDTYTLYANANPILAGVLRDYSDEGAPYTNPNFLFFGDNTTSASGSFQVTNIDLTDAPYTATAVPFEFSPTLGLIILGGIFGANKLRKIV